MSASGLVFAGQDGTATITVTNSGFSDTAVATIQTFSPTALSYVNIPGSANNVDVSGVYAYEAAGSTGLQVVNVSDRSNPTIVASEDTLGNANDVKVVGNKAFIADGNPVEGATVITVNDLSGVTITDGTFSIPNVPTIYGDIRVNATFTTSGGILLIGASSAVPPVLGGSTDVGTIVIDDIPIDGLVAYCVSEGCRYYSH